MKFKLLAADTDPRDFARLCTSGVCPTGWKTVGGDCQLFLSGRDKARAGEFCREMGAEYKAGWATLIGRGQSRLCSHWLTEASSLLCHKDTAQGSPKTFSWVISCLSLCLYGIRENISGLISDLKWSSMEQGGKLATSQPPGTCASLSGEKRDPVPVWKTKRQENVQNV